MNTANWMNGSVECGSSSFKKFHIHSESIGSGNHSNESFTQKTDTLQQNEYLIEVLRDVFVEIKLGEPKTVLVNSLYFKFNFIFIGEFAFFPFDVLFPMACFFIWC